MCPLKCITSPLCRSSFSARFLLPSFLTVQPRTRGTSKRRHSVFPEARDRGRIRTILRLNYLGATEIFRKLSRRSTRKLRYNGWSVTLEESKSGLDRSNVKNFRRFARSQRWKGPGHLPRSLFIRGWYFGGRNWSKSLPTIGARKTRWEKSRLSVSSRWYKMPGKSLA